MGRWTELISKLILLKADVHSKVRIHCGKHMGHISNEQSQSTDICCFFEVLHGYKAQ